MIGSLSAKPRVLFALALLTVGIVLGTGPSGAAAASAEGVLGLMPAPESVTDRKSVV